MNRLALFVLLALIPASAARATTTDDVRPAIARTFLKATGATPLGGDIGDRATEGLGLAIGLDRTVNARVRLGLQADYFRFQASEEFVPNGVNTRDDDNNVTYGARTCVWLRLADVARMQLVAGATAGAAFGESKEAKGFLGSVTVGAHRGYGRDAGLYGAEFGARFSKGGSFLVLQLVLSFASN